MEALAGLSIGHAGITANPNPAVPRSHPPGTQRRAAGLRQRHSLPSRISARGELLTLHYANYINHFLRRAHSSVVLADVQRSAQ
jgi:hypothetical protein